MLFFEMNIDLWIGVMPHSTPLNKVGIPDREIGKSRPVSNAHLLGKSESYAFSSQSGKWEKKKCPEFPDRKSPVPTFRPVKNVNPDRELGIPTFPSGVECGIKSAERIFYYAEWTDIFKSARHC